MTFPRPLLRCCLIALPALSLAACQPGVGDDDACTDGASILGCGEHDIDAVSVVTIGDSNDGLFVPRDLAFNPERRGELWTVNRGDDGVVIYRDIGTDDQSAEHIVDPYAFHFMEEVSSIAFGKPGHFATCQESRNTYNDQGAPNDFMGPALWSSDMDIFGQTNPEATEYLSDLWNVPPGSADLGSHLDMLHESPLCMGIAWDRDNVYWVFDGGHSAIVRYDFQEDHGAGYDDHSDGIVGRYVDADVTRLPDVPSHMVLDHDTGLLYVADTGNQRIAVLDTNTGERGGSLPASEPGVDYYQVTGADWSVLIEGDEVGLQEPSGLALHGGLLYVGDHADGTILAFTLDGDVVDWLEMGADDLMGLEFGPDGALYYADGGREEIGRIATVE